MKNMGEVMHSTAGSAYSIEIRQSETWANFADQLANRLKSTAFDSSSRCTTRRICWELVIGFSLFEIEHADNPGWDMCADCKNREESRTSVSDSSENIPRRDIAQELKALRP
jgi:hypothetical protein